MANQSENVLIKEAFKQPDFKEKVVEIKRVSNTTKGGKQIAFTALVVSGDQKGKLGIGFGKAKSVSDAVQKATARARRTMSSVNITAAGGIPHQVSVKYHSASIMIRPGKIGDGIKAGGAVRAVVEVAGVKDIVSKIKGSRNKSLNVWAAYKALSALK